MKNLTPADWQEIYYALDSKLYGVKNGAYRMPISKQQSKDCYKACVREEDREQMRWARHLETIMKKLGQDAKNVTRGLSI